MSITCVALLSGGLDSILAIRLMQEQGIDVHALNFQTVFTCCKDESGRAASELSVPLTVIGDDDEYLQLIRRPRFGYGKGANPCVDCRIYMFARAKRFLDQIGGQFVVSGEVVGQRPMSQKRRDLEIISAHSGLEDLLLRPLSAQFLPLTLPERNGWVDRSKLHRFSGRSRKGLIELARRFGLSRIPSPSNGCALTETSFGHKVHDLVQLDHGNRRWDFELLKVGRHYRLKSGQKVVVGRNEKDNEALQYMTAREDARAEMLLEPENFIGPAAMVVGLSDRDTLPAAGALLLRHASRCDSDAPTVRVTRTNGIESYPLNLDAVDAASTARNVSERHPPRPNGGPTP